MVNDFEFPSGEVINMDPDKVDFDKFTFEDEEEPIQKLDPFEGLDEEEKKEEKKEEKQEVKVEKPTKEIKTEEDIWEQPNEETSEENEDSIVDFAKLFYEKAGFGEFDASELEDDSLEGFIKHITDIVERDSKPTYSNDFVAELDLFVKKGGDPKQFFDLYYGDNAELNINNVEVQRDIVAKHLKETTKWSETKIEKHIARLELDEELESEAKEAYASLLEQNKEKRAAMIKQQEELIQKQEQERQESIKYLDTLITKGTSEELGFDLSKKEREEFRKFVFEVDNSGLTGYQKYLASQKNAEVRLALVAFKGLTDQKAVEKVAEKTGNKNITKKLNQLATNSSGANKQGTNRGGNNNNNNLFAAFE